MSAQLLGFLTGFLSLSIEILWIRLFSFANHSLPQAFAWVLTFYLLGIALGAYVGKLLCQSRWNLWVMSGSILLLSGLVDLVTPFIYAYSVHTSLQMECGTFFIVLTSFLKALIFPIAHHLRAPTTSRAIASVYAANIFGATLGPLLMGMVLLSVFTTQQCFLLCAILSAVIGMLLLDAGKIYVVAIFLLFLSTFSINKSSLIEKSAQFGPIKQLIENQYGIITVYNDPQNGDVVYGGNVYDGRTNLDPLKNSNHINRLLILSAIKTKPTRVLMIGLSIGSWLKLLTGFPEVKSIDVVEINPGYLDAIQHYPPQQQALLDPRVHLYFNDGRRWLKSHPNFQYDLIIMNTTYHWRAYATALLSQEFLTLIKDHMNANAVLAYNATDSPDVFKTAARVFTHAYLYENFVIAADFDWRKKLRATDAIAKLQALQFDNHPLFPPNSKRYIIRYLHENVFEFREVEQFFNALGRHVEVVNDHNLITEFKYGQPLRKIEFNR